MKKGFTLMELMVYLALIGVIVLVAGQAFSDSTKFRVRSKNMLASTESASNLSEIIKEDFAQMGAKSWKDISASSSADVFDVDSNVYVDPDTTGGNVPDSSSYELKRASGNDSIAFRKIEYTEAGDFLAVRKISWYVKSADSSLWRACQTISGKESLDCPKVLANVEPVKMAKQVVKFSLEPSTPGNSSASTSDTLFPASSSSGFRLIPRVDSTGKHFYPLAGITPVEGANSVTLGPFTNANNYSSSSGIRAIEAYVAPAVDQIASSDTWKTQCQKFTFVPGEVYSFEFNLVYVGDNMRSFQAGVDHFAVGLRTTSGNPISGMDDFMIYPPQARSASTFRYGNFSVRSSTTACFVMTFAFYSPTAYKGTINLVNFRVLRETDASFHFTESESYNPTTGEKKKRTKAFLLNLDVFNKGEVGKIRLILPTPSNGTSAMATST